MQPLEKTFKDQLMEASAIILTTNAYKLCLVEDPSEEVVQALLKHGYVDETGTPEGNRMLKIYEDRTKHGFAGYSVFVTKP